MIVDDFNIFKVPWDKFNKDISILEELGYKWIKDILHNNDIPEI